MPKLKLQVVPRREQAHSSAFMEHYASLRAWALRLTNGDQAEAEDVLHDAFVQFVRLAPDLAQIENLGAYLNRLLRNLHLAHITRRTRVQYVDLEVLEYDSLALSLRHTHPLRLRELEEELKSICAWAISRREETRAACFLILRFFLGQLPSEIARLCVCSRESLEKGLQSARAEIRRTRSTPAWPEMRRRLEQRMDTRLPLDLWLRRVIFAEPATPCMPQSALRHVLQENIRTRKPIERSLLVHLTSCASCLEQANRLLQHLSLSERDGGHHGGKGSSGGSDALVHRALRSCEEIFEHRPAHVELCVNAEPEMSFTVQSRRTVLVVELNRTRTIDFIEAFSEQGVRLLYMPVISPDDGGLFLQDSAISFSEGRELSIEISFRNPKTEIVICYTDPQHHVRPAVTKIERGAFGELEHTGPSGWLDRLRASLMPGIPVRPWSYALLLLLIVLLPVTQDRQVALSAEELLTRAAHWEEQRSHDDSVIHRSFEYVESSAGKDSPVRRKRVETWSNSARHRTLRRLLDTSGSVQASSTERLASAPTSTTAWEYVPDAESFRLLSSIQHAQIARSEGRIRISTADTSLELDPATCHPLEQRFHVEERQIQIAEISNEVIPIAASPLREELPSPILPPAVPPLPSRVALEETELNVRERLHVLDADLGEDIRILSTPREVLVSGVIESIARRSLIEQNLHSLPLVQLALLSPEEAARHEHLTRVRASEGGEMEQPLLLSWLKTQWPAMEERDQHVQQMLTTLDRCSEHVLAWSELQQRYPVHADPRVNAMERDHEQRATEAIDQLLSMLPSVEADNADAPPVTSSPMQAQQLNRDLEQLLTVHVAPENVPAASLAQVRRNLAGLAHAMRSTTP